METLQIVTLADWPSVIGNMRPTMQGRAAEECKIRPTQAFPIGG